MFFNSEELWLLEETGYESRQISKLKTTVLLFMFTWKLPYRVQSLFFCSQIVNEWINTMFLLVSKFKMIVMLLNVVHGQVQKVTKTYNRQV